MGNIVKEIKSQALGPVMITQINPAQAFGPVKICQLIGNSGPGTARL